MASIEVGHEHADAGASEMALDLVADDDPDIRFSVSRLLAGPGTPSSRPRTARGALPGARAQTDLLILDVSMPGADGYAVCRALQAEMGSELAR